MKLKNRKTLCILGALSLLCLICGCGQVAKSTISNNTQPTVSQTAMNSSAADISALKFLLSSNILNGRNAEQLVEASQTGQSIAASSPFQTSGFSAQKIDYKTDEFWEEVTSKKPQGNLIGNIEQKYRYYDKRTGQTFTKSSKQFTTTDWNNVDYIEELQVISVNYSTDPTVFLTLKYHSKITILDLSKNSYRYEKWEAPSVNDPYAQVFYAYFVNKTTQVPVTLYIRTMDWTYDPQNGFQGKLILHGTNYCVLDVKDSWLETQGTFYLTYSSLNNNIYTFADERKMVEIAYNNQKGYLETTYYVGSGRVYTDFDYIGGGIEDNCILKIYPYTSGANRFYGNTIDGSKNLGTGTDFLKNVTIANATTTSLMIDRLECKNIRNLYIETSLKGDEQNPAVEKYLQLENAYFSNCTFADEYMHFIHNPSFDGASNEPLGNDGTVNNKVTWDNIHP